MVKTTAMGSFPYLPGDIAAVMDLQCKYGIDIVCDGQLRYDMNTYFARAIYGFEPTLDRPRLTGKIDGTRPDGIQEIINDLQAANRRICIRSSADYMPELKANLTGPVTLVSSSTFEASGEYRNPFKLDEKGRVINKRLWLHLGNAMNRIVKAYEEKGIQHIQIDEPMVSADRKNPFPFLKLALKRIISGDLNYETNFYLHVCGDIRDRFEELAELDHIKGLSFEFAGSPVNLEAISRERLESNEYYPKKLLLGVLDSKEPEPDNILDIVARNKPEKKVKEAIAPYVKDALRIYAMAANRAGKHNIPQINPDCGLRGFRRLGADKGPKAAHSKLRILQEVKNEINGRGELFKEALEELNE